MCIQKISKTIDLWVKLTKLKNLSLFRILEIKSCQSAWAPLSFWLIPHHTTNCSFFLSMVFFTLNECRIQLRANFKSITSCCKPNNKNCSFSELWKFVGSQRKVQETFGAYNATLTTFICNITKNHCVLASVSCHALWYTFTYYQSYSKCATEQ